MQTQPTTTETFTGPASEQQRARILHEEVLVATARYQRDPSDAHRAELYAVAREHQRQPAITAASKDLAQRDAARRVAQDARGCLCRRCPTSKAVRS